MKPARVTVREDIIETLSKLHEVKQQKDEKDTIFLLMLNFPFPKLFL